MTLAGHRARPRQAKPPWLNRPLPFHADSTPKPALHLRRQLALRVKVGCTCKWSRKGILQALFIAPKQHEQHVFDKLGR